MKWCTVCAKPALGIMRAHRAAKFRATKIDPFYSRLR